MLFTINSCDFVVVEKQLKCCLSNDYRFLKLFPYYVALVLPLLAGVCLHVFIDF